MFKMARISEFEPTRTSFVNEHDDPAVLLERAFQGNGRKGLDITLLCKAEIKVQICEYLAGTITETFENGDFILRIHVLEDERMWFAMLLSFGDKIKVIEPEGLVSRIKETADNILSLYQEQ